MNFSTAEIELLCLIGWTKTLPLSLQRLETMVVAPSGIEVLCECHLAVKTKDGQRIRLTPTGRDFLTHIGFHYHQDAKLIYDEGKLARRDEAAKTLFTFYRAGLEVFADTPEALDIPLVYLSAAAARRNAAYGGNRVWGGCRMAGIARLYDSSYIVHYVSQGGMYFAAEMELFRKLTDGRCKTTGAMFLADSYQEVARMLITESPLRGRGAASGLVTVREACKRIEIPLHLVECSNVGAFQIMVMQVPEYRKKVAALALAGGYEPPLEELPDTDATLDGRPLLIAVDMDIKRIGRAWRAAKTNGFEKLLIVALPEQLDALKLLFQSTRAVELYQLSGEHIADSLGLKLYEPTAEQYLTKEGRTLSATDVPIRTKAGRPSRKKVEAPEGERRR